MHVCSTECEGKDRLSGLHFICHDCSAKVLARCVADDHDTAVLILSALNVIISNDDGTAQVNVTQKTRADFELVFGVNSSFRFVCDTCKDEKANRIEQINELQNEVEDLKTRVNEKNNTIHTLTDGNDSPNEILFNDDDELPTNIGQLSNIFMIKTKQLLAAELDNVSANFSRECKKIKQQFMKLSNRFDAMCVENEEEVRPKPNPFSKKKTNDAHQQKGILEAMTNNETNGHDEHVSTGTNIVFSDKLNPDNIPTANMVGYTMHLSQLPVEATIGDVTDHIMNNTTIINDEAFTVEKIGKPGADYSSFKITTLTAEACAMIKSAWEQKYPIRDFYDSRKKGSFNNEYKNSQKFNAKKRFAQRSYSNRNQFNKMYRNETHDDGWRENANRRSTNKQRNSRNDNIDRWHTPKRMNQNDRTLQQTPKHSSRNDENVRAQDTTIKSNQPAQPFYLIPYQQPMTQPVQPLFLGNQLAPPMVQQVPQQHQYQQVQHQPQPQPYPQLITYQTAM